MFTDSKRVLGDPYIPTPPKLVRAKLEFAEVERGECVFDLGCGDGRVPIMAAKRYGARGVGIELQPSVAEIAWSKVVDHAVEDRVEIRCEDYLESDLSAADVVVLYMTFRTLATVSDKLRELKPGARVVTHDFPLTGWALSQQGSWTSSKARVVPLFLYRVPSR